MLTATRTNFARTPLGWLRIVAGPLGVVECNFDVDSSVAKSAGTTQTSTDAAQNTQADPALSWVRDFFRGLRSATPKLMLQGTAWEQEVWQAVLKIPYASIATYQEIAALAGRPQAVRAAALAVAKNKLALFVPCHRIVPRHKLIEKPFGEYRWGSWRKEVLLRLEAQGENFAKNSWSNVDRQAALV